MRMSTSNLPTLSSAPKLGPHVLIELEPLSLGRIPTSDVSLQGPHGRMERTWALEVNSPGLLS